MEFILYSSQKIKSCQLKNFYELIIIAYFPLLPEIKLKFLKEIIQIKHFNSTIIKSLKKILPENENNTEHKIKTGLLIR